jgi:hypothetical protein
MQVRELKQLLSHCADGEYVYIESLYNGDKITSLLSVAINGNCVVLRDHLITRAPKRIVCGYDGVEYEVPWT